MTEKKNVRTVNPDCRWFAWIGQALVHCDQCGAPVWVHEGLPKRPTSLFGIADPVDGDPWREGERWYEFHQRWLQGWEIIVEDGVVLAKPPVEEEEPETEEEEPNVEEQKIEINPAISVADIVFSLISDLDEDQMVEVVRIIDREMHSWQFSQGCFDYFKGEMEKLADS